MTAELAPIPSLDLVLESIVDGRETFVNERGRGEPEILVVPSSRDARRLCFRISAAPGVQRGDATSPYTLRLASGARDAP
jgi:hypothetical protein